MRSRGRRVLVVELQAPRGHQVDQQRQPALDVDDQVLAAAAHRLDPLARERRQRRVEGLQGVDAGRERRLDLRARERAIEQARGDLDLGQLGHSASS